MTPLKTQVMGKPAPWDDEITALWNEKVVPLFKEGETCEQANYYKPRPYVDEYNRGSDLYGFTYTVNPGRHVCFVSWRRAQRVTI